jgi:DNA-binding NarL/FixJ family response regulator
MATAVLESLPPAYASGLGRALEDAGHKLTDDLLAADVFIVGMRSIESCERIDDLVRANSRVICLLEPFDSETIAHALYHKVAPADWNAPPLEAVAVVEAALRDEVVLPAAFADGLATLGSHPHAGARRLTEEEVNWLRDLAAGATVVHIADHYGYSERAMFRRLHDLYARLGASGRAQALVAAQRLRVLE